MNNADSVIYQRPNYYQGQLLDAKDFLDEQKYHVDARRRHNLTMHGCGVVRGLEVTRNAAGSVTIAPGYAIDSSGQEVFLKESKEIDLATFGPNDLLALRLGNADAGDIKGAKSAEQKRLDVYARISVSKGLAEGTGIILATIELDDQGKISENAIGYKHTQYVRVLAPGSINSEDLHPSLKTGWLRLPFRPVALVNMPEGEKKIPPAFRVGATEALSPRPENGQEDQGAAGTMAFPIPPNATHVTRLRIAGERNDGKIKFAMLLGGWDPVEKKHARKTLLETEISTPGPFMETFDIKDTPLDAEYQTMSLWLRGTRRTSISLVAAEFSYY